MKDLFKHYFTGVMPTERLDLYSRIIDHFERVGYTAPFEELQEIMELGSSHNDNAGVCSSVSTVMVIALHELSKSIGIVFKEHTDLDIMFAITEAVMCVEDYSTPHELSHILREMTTPEEAVCYLCEFIAGLRADDVLEVLESVNKDLVVRINEWLKKLDAIYDSLNYEPVDNGDRIKKLNSFLRKYKSELSLLPKHISNNRQIAITEFDMLVSEDIEAITLMHGEDLAVELVGLYLFSKEPLEGLTKAVAAAISEVTDLDPIVRVATMRLKDITNSFDVS